MTKITELRDERLRSEVERRLEVIREAVADYMRSEGCGCCSDRAAHSEHAKRLGELLNVPKFSDGSGYDFSKFESKR